MTLDPWNRAIACECGWTPLDSTQALVWISAIKASARTSAALMGACGGRAGTGPAKRRGDAGFYRRLVALRKDRQGLNSGMRHRHLNHQDFTLAAIDDIINNGVQPSCLTGSPQRARSSSGGSILRSRTGGSQRQKSGDEKHGNTARNEPRAVPQGLDCRKTQRSILWGRRSRSGLIATHCRRKPSPYFRIAQQREDQISAAEPGM